MKDKTLLGIELSLGALVGIIAVAILKRTTPIKTSPGGSRDKPIIVSGGSLHLSSRATFSTTRAGVFQASSPSCVAKSVYVSVNGSDPVCYTPTLPWSVTLTGASGTLTIASTDGTSVTFDKPQSSFTDLFTDTFTGSMKKHNTITSVSTITLSNLSGSPLPPAVMGNVYYVYINYNSD